jgi:hypothetical protein
MSELLSGAEMVRHLIHSCQSSIARYHTKGLEAEQAGDQESAQQWYRLSEGENQILQKYWALGGEHYLKESRSYINTAESTS